MNLYNIYLKRVVPHDQRVQCQERWILFNAPQSIIRRQNYLTQRTANANATQARIDNRPITRLEEDNATAELRAAQDAKFNAMKEALIVKRASELSARTIKETTVR